MSLLLCLLTLLEWRANAPPVEAVSKRQPLPVLTLPFHGPRPQNQHSDTESRSSMDPFSLTAGALQIAGACAQCTVAIIKICGDIRTVDARISSFCDEVTALQATYEGLEKSLSSPLMAEAARIANQTTDGAQLWIQIKEALNDSKRTMKRVNEILAHITKTSGFGRKVKTHLHESIASGELSRLRQRIQFFNAALSLPIQMVCVMLQLEQRGMTTEHQTSLDTKLSSLERTMRDLVRSLSMPARSQTLGGSTIVDSEKATLDQDDGMKTYIAFAKQFLTTASAAASTRSSLSTVSPAIEADLLGGRKPSITESSLPGDHRARLESWIQPPSTESCLNHHQRSSTHSHPPPGRESVSIEEDSEVEFMRTKRHLKLGQEKSEQSDHAKAEIHFRKALALMEEKDFDGRIALHPAEVVLMLADSCLKQDKFDESVALLLPVAAMRPGIFPGGSKTDDITEPRRSPTCQRPDKLQALAASHMLGQVFVLKGDFESAEDHGLRAFTERRKELGPRDEKTLDSVQLVIDIYRAQGDEEEAEGYEVFLSPPENTGTSPHSLSTDKLLTQAEGPRSVPALIPPEPATPPHPMQRNQRSSIAQRLRQFGRSSQPTLAQSPPLTDLHRLSISRSTTLNEPFLDAEGGPLRGLSSPSESSTHERSLSTNDDDSITTPSSGRMERSSSSRVLEPTYIAIAQLCDERKFDRAIKMAIQYLDTYNSHVMIVRRMELKENIKRGIGQGLARTGKGYAPLHFFCELREEYAEEVNLLIKHGVDVNAVAYQAGYTQSNPLNAFTALQQATERGYSTITALLLATEGIKTDVRDFDGLTPLMVACRKGHHTIVKQLLQFPLPTAFPPTWHGNTLLHDAARRCDPILVEMLLDRSTNIDERDRFGKTALMHAVIKSDVPDPVERRKRSRGRCKTVQALLEAGADPTLRDTRTQKTVREYAVKVEDGELMTLLDQAPRRGVSELLA